jgi:hypothetical protein
MRGLGDPWCKDGSFPSASPLNDAYEALTAWTSPRM